MKEFEKHFIDLLAYIVKFHKEVSKEEIHFISDLLNQKFKENSDKIFNYFIEALSKNIRLEELLSQINDDYKSDYNSKIKLIIQIYELIASDKVGEEEVKLFNDISSFIQIKDEDVDLINSLYIDAYDYEFRSNIDRKIAIGDDIKSFDLICSNANAEIFIIEDKRFIINKHIENIFIDNVVLYSRQIHSLENNDIIYFKENKIPVKMIDQLFEINKAKIKKDIYFNFDKESLIMSKISSEADPVFRIVIERNLVRIYNLKNDLLIKINGIEAEAFEFINIADVITINGYNLPLYSIITNHKRDSFTFRDREVDDNTLTISNKNKKAVFYIADSFTEPLDIKIIIEKKRNCSEYVLMPESIPYDVFLNNEKLSSGKNIRINSRSKLIIDKIQFLFEPKKHKIYQSEINFDKLTVKNLTHVFPDGTRGMDNISFEAKSGELNCIMGPSGSGKSTLLMLLLGYLKPLRGEVLINGNDLYDNFDRIKHYIGYVPQNDLLIENLTVYENLYYTAKIRTPQKSKEEIGLVIDRILKELGLIDKKYSRVGNVVDKVLSGGQRKRLNIGLELVANPDIFFLDEPTSGLSSKDSELIIDILEKLAQNGKIIFVVIHQPNSDIYKRFNNLLLLDIGGKLAYYGDVLEAITYFKQFLPGKDVFIECPSCGNVNPELIFNILEEKELGQDGLPIYYESIDASPLKFINKIFKNKNVNKILRRKYDPEYWRNLFLSKRYMIKSGEEADTNISDKKTYLPSKKKFGLFKKIIISISLFRRTFFNQLNDKSNIIMTFLVPSILGIVLSVLLKGRTHPYNFEQNEEFHKYLFLSSIIFIFLGLMASINQIIKDRPLLMREKIIDVSPWQYMTSKIFVFFIFSSMQVFLFVLPGFLILHIPIGSSLNISDLNLSYPNLFIYFYLISFITSYVSYSLGFLISSFLKSEYTASNIVPLIIIPQILFGGLFIEFSTISKNLFIQKSAHLPEFSNLIFSRWSYEALLAGSDDFNPMNLIIDTRFHNDKTFDFDKRDEIIKKLKITPIDKIPKEISYKYFYKSILEKDEFIHYRKINSVNEKEKLYFYEKDVTISLDSENIKKIESRLVLTKEAMNLKKEKIEEFGSDYTNLKTIWKRTKNRNTILSYYKPDNVDEEESVYFILKDNITANDKEIIHSIFKTAIFNMKYNSYSPNKEVAKLFYNANNHDWQHKLDHLDGASFTSYLKNDNVFPAIDKIFGSFKIKTVWYNLIILIIQGLFLNIAVIFRLRKL